MFKSYELPELLLQLPQSCDEIRTECFQLMIKTLIDFSFSKSPNKPQTKPLPNR